MEPIAEAFMIPIEKLEPHPHNPRGPVDPAAVEDLVASIKEKGVQVPLLVVPVKDQARRGFVKAYRVVAGHRRRVGAIEAGLKSVPAILKTYSEEEQEEMMLIENLQREDLTPLEEARAFQRMVVERGVTLNDIVRKTGVGLARVQSTLQIVKLTPKVQELFGNNMLPITCVRPLLDVVNPDQQYRLAVMVAERRLSVIKLKEIAATMSETGSTDADVEKARAQKAKQKTVPTINGLPAVTYTRAEVVTKLETLNGAALTFSDMRQTVEGVCGRCGMSTLPQICSACPLPQFLGNLMNGVANDTVNKSAHAARV